MSAYWNVFASTTKKKLIDRIVSSVVQVSCLHPVKTINKTLLSNAMPDSISVPTDITFEQAIHLTHALLAEIEAGTLSEAEIQATLTELVRSENGARGFFVTYLTNDRSLSDHPTSAVVSALQSSPDIVAELLVKNIAMSTAMAITHRRNQNEEMAQGSDRVQRRTAQLAQLVQLPQISEKAAKLQASAAGETGDYQAFLDRWNYDAEQRQAIQAAVQRMIA